MSVFVKFGKTMVAFTLSQSKESAQGQRGGLLATMLQFVCATQSFAFCFLFSVDFLLIFHFESQLAPMRFFITVGELLYQTNDVSVFCNEYVITLP